MTTEEQKKHLEKSKHTQLLRAYFKWHKEKGYVSHKECDIDEFTASYYEQIGGILCAHKHIESSDNCDECLDCGLRNY